MGYLNPFLYNCSTSSTARFRSAIFMEITNSSSFRPPNFLSAKLGIETFGFPVKIVLTQESEQVDSPTKVNSSFRSQNIASLPKA